MLRSVLLFFILLLVWLLLSGHYTFLIISLGIVSCLFCVYLTRRANILDNELLPVTFFPRIFQYIIWLIKEIIVSNIITAKVILTSSENPEIFVVKCSQKTPEGKTTYANSITLTPGTVTTDIKNNILEVHALTSDFGDDVRSGDMDKKVTWLEKEI